MDRGKMSSTGRGGKSKAPQHPQDIFALGSRSTVVVSRDSEKRNIHKPSTSGVERKREATSFVPQPPGKRSRIGSPAESVTGTSLELDPVDLVPHVLQALDTHNSDKLLGLLTSSIRLLKTQRSKPDPVLCRSLLYLVKIRPNMFAHETVTQTLCSLLKREQGAAFKNKGNPLVFVLACNMLYAAHKDSRNWPDTFIKVYIEDALNERWWVDCAWCKCLVENIVTAFNTKQPPAHLIPTDNILGTMSPSGSGSPLMGSTDEDTADVSEIEYSVFPRYTGSYETVEAMVLEAIKEQIQRRAAPDAIGKGFLKLLAATCGFPEIRMISAARLEGWLHSGKLWRGAVEVLATVCVNVAGAAPRDHDVLAQLARMRLKTKPLQQAYVSALREMVTGDAGLLRAVITHTVYNELSSVRAPHNLPVLAALLNAQPTRAPHALADTYLELLLRPEDYARGLRALTRELVRSARGDPAALVPLARALGQAPPQEPPAEIRERAFTSLTEVFCACCLVAAGGRGVEGRAVVAGVQAAALGWLLDGATVYRPSPADYRAALTKIMFVDGAESYSKVDNWPPESERAQAYRVCCEAPLPQASLLRILFIGLSKETPISGAEALELAETVVRRACSLPPEERPLVVDKLELADYVFQLTTFQAPDNVQLPAGYTPPPLAITSLYWRAWSLLTMVCAHNPSGFAERAAAMYPTLRALIDTCITNKPSIEWSNMTQAEVEAERAAILQLETHLAAASNSKLPITEHNSRLLSQLTRLDTTGPARRPPAAVLDVLTSQASSLRLGRLLCRTPALLLELLQRHGMRRALPWLHHLLTHDQLQLSVLPVACVCELVALGAWGGGRAPELAARLRRVVAERADGARAVLQYYMTRLAHGQRRERDQAHVGLKLVLSPNPDEAAEMDFNAEVSPDEWIPGLYTLEWWDSLRDEVVAGVRAACLAECAPRALRAYLRLLRRHVEETADEEHAGLAYDMGVLIMERMSVTASLLPGERGADVHAHQALYDLTYILHHYMQKIRVRWSPEAAPQPPHPEAPAAEGERLWVRWHTAHATLPALLAHAQLKLLCLGPSDLDTNNAMYNWLVSSWVEEAPSALDAATLAPGTLLPDWLRLHLVRSARGPLLERGLRGLPAHKLALFIQTFGMPVAAITALLRALDACPAGAVARLGVERPYMSLLLRVQRQRGARGGDAFAAALGLTAPPPPPPNESLFSDLPPVPQPARPAPRPPPAPGLVLAAALGPAPSGPDTDAHYVALLCGLQKETAASRRARAPTPLWTATLQHLRAPTVPLGPRAVPLMRAMMAPPQGLRSDVRMIAENLLKQYKCSVNPIVNILREIVKLSGHRLKISPDQQDIPTIPAYANKEQLVSLLESCSSLTLEPVGRRMIQTVTPELVVEVLTCVLERNQNGVYDVEIKNESGPSTVSPLSRAGRGCGLLLDWLCDLQHDTLGGSPVKQMGLLFVSVHAPWRPLLATQLAHRASWRTLHAALERLLRSTGTWQASSVLKFSETLTRSPRVWQGRDRSTPKHHRPDNLLALTYTQLRVLVQYIIEEASSFPDADGQRRAIEARLPLLLQCCPEPAHLLCALGEDGEGEERERTVGGGRKQAEQMLLLLLYLKVPKLLNLLDECSEVMCEAEIVASDEAEEAATKCSSEADVVAHCMLTALAATTNNTKAARLEAGSRALLRRHWRVVARCLPLLTSLLQAARPTSRAALMSALEMSPSLTPDQVDTLRPLRSSLATSLTPRLAALLRRLNVAGPMAGPPESDPPSSLTPPPAALRVLQAGGGGRDVLTALQEIETWGARRGGSWGGAAAAGACVRAVAPLVLSSRAVVRAAALALLAKLLPAVGHQHQAEMALLSALESARGGLASGALAALPELAPALAAGARRVWRRALEEPGAAARAAAARGPLRGC